MVRSVASGLLVGPQRSLRATGWSAAETQGYWLVRSGNSGLLLRPQRSLRATASSAAVWDVMDESIKFSSLVCAREM